MHLAYPELRYFAFLRDPVKRYLSHYRNRPTRTAARTSTLGCRALDAQLADENAGGEESAQKAIDLIASAASASSGSPRASTSRC